MYALKFTVINFAGVMKTLRKIDDILDNERDDGAIAAMHKVGEVYQRNFDSEGRLTGRAWRSLAESTQRERARLGFPPERPILIRYGSLKHATSVYLQTAPKQATYTSTDPDGKTISISINTSADTATVYASGEKAANQTGGGTLPERPFWFVTQRVMDEAKEGVVDWLADAIQKAI